MMFRAFKMMLNDTPNRCPASGNDFESGHTVLAGVSSAGDVVQVLLSNYGGTLWHPRIKLHGPTADRASLSSLVIDSDRNLEADPADPAVFDGSDIMKHQDVPLYEAVVHSNISICSACCSSVETLSFHSAESGPKNYI